MALLVHNNHVYGLTKGQISPTSTRDDGFITRPQPEGSFVEPFNPLVTAIASNAGFVARGFTGEPEQLAEIDAILPAGAAAGSRYSAPGMRAINR